METVFDKPLDKKVASLNDHISNLIATKNGSYTVSFTESWTHGYFETNIDFPTGYHVASVYGSTVNPWADAIIMYCTNNSGKCRISYAAKSTRTLSLGVDYTITFVKD